MSLGALLANKMRSLLTMLGVIIGVAAVIALVSLGQSAQAQIELQMTALGTNLITVSAMGQARFVAGDAEMLLERVPTLAYATPSLSYASTPVKSRVATYTTRFEGVSHQFMEVRDYSLQIGRFFAEHEVANRRNVAVLGYTAYQQLFQGRDAIGEVITIRGQQFTVVGVTAPKGASMGQDYDDRIFIPYTTAQRLVGTRYIQTIIFKAESREVATLAADHLSRILEEKFRDVNRSLDPRVRATPPFRVFSQDEMLETVSAMTATFTVLLAGIAAVSLLVGGIGIMNIMLVSVTERTREIGIRKAIGAKRADILLQFLVESVVISATGGVIGILFGSQLARFLGSFNHMDIMISPSAVVLAFGFSSAVGMFFGIYPAYKAARLDPIVALRYE